MKLKEKIKKIKLLLLDVDGVLTNGSIVLGESNQELKIFNIHDGMGIKLAQAAGIEVGIITGRASATVEKRADELNIKILYQGQQNKLVAYEQIKKELQMNDRQIAYVGDDLHDLRLLRTVGVSFTVNDACDEVKKEVDYVTKHQGGKGAVREIVELILKNQSKWQAVIKQY